MSRPSATSSPRPPLPAFPSHSTPNEIPIPRQRTIHAKCDPFVSITYALFSIPNFSHPLSFVTTAHSLPKTPGSSISKKIFWPLRLPCLIPIDAISSKNTLSNPFRIYFFRKYGRGGLPTFPSSFTLTFTDRARVPQLAAAQKPLPLTPGNLPRSLTTSGKKGSRGPF
jgi:hypothetical protein